MLVVYIRVLLVVISELQAIILESKTTGIIDMVGVPTTNLICEYLAEHKGKQVHVKDVANRFNIFTHGASLRMSACGWHPVGDTGYWTS
jgi:hypothetical protein